MEKQELQRKIIATVVATVVLCALLAVSIWLLLTTDVFPPLIKGLMVACCVLLAAAIAGFLRNKLVEIRTLRLCMRDNQPQHEYSEVYDDSEESTASSRNNDSVETMAVSEPVEADFFAPAEDVFAEQDFAAENEPDVHAATPVAPANAEATFFAQSTHEKTLATAQPTNHAQPQHNSGVQRTPQMQRSATPLTAQPIVAQAAQVASVARTARAPQPTPATRPVAQQALQSEQMIAEASTEGHTQAQPVQTAQAPRAAQAVQMAQPQPIVRTPQQTVTPQPPQRQPAPALQTAQSTAAVQTPGTVAHERPLSPAQQQAVAYNTRMAEEQAAQRAATIAAAQERARTLQMAQEASLHRHVQERTAAQQAAQQRIVAELAAAQQQASYAAAQAPQPVARTQAETGGTYHQTAIQQQPPAPATQRVRDPEMDLREAQIAAAARAAAQIAEREAQARSQSANAAAQSAEESASRSTEAAARAEARLRALIGLPAEDETAVPASVAAVQPQAASDTDSTITPQDAPTPKHVTSWLTDTASEKKV